MKDRDHETVAATARSRGRGRPRHEEIDGLILDATLALVDAEEEVTLARVVARSGVSRAALYRRWPSLTALVATALDVGRTMPPEIPVDGNFSQTLRTTLFTVPDVESTTRYSEARFRQRIRLVMVDRALQRAYWSTHVAHRRIPMENALREGVNRGVLRADLDVEACYDTIAGITYYQVVVRGDRLDAASTRRRVNAALDLVWRGILA